MKGKVKMSKEKEIFIALVNNCCFNDDGQYDDLTFTDEEVEIAKQTVEIVSGC